MNVILLTEGGQAIGFGHLTRCQSLYQALEARNHSPHFIVKGDETVKGILRGQDYRVFDWVKEKEELSRAVKAADVVIIDSYLAGLEIYREISGKAKLAVYLDDTHRHHYPAGVVINWNIDARAADYPEDPKITYLLGAGYISLRKAFWTVKKKEIPGEVRRVMVTFGGDDSRNLTPGVLEFLTGNYPAVEKNIIIGRAFENIDEIEKVKDSRTYLHFLLDGEGMKRVMEESDIAISSGGQTLNELARVGVPTVAVAVAENQLENVKAWERAGFIENAGFWTGRDLMEKLAARYRSLLSYERREQASERGRQLVPGNGADRVIDFLEKKLENLP